jgi:hypothetical protein
MCSDTTTINNKITETDILNSIDKLNNLLRANEYVQYTNCYMSWNKFLKLFPNIYNLVWYDGADWWFKGEYIKIVLLWNNDLLLDDDIVFERCDNNVLY